MREVQKKRNTWSWNVVRPTGIVGFTPQCKLVLHRLLLCLPPTTDQILLGSANGMTEALTLAVYFLLCRETGEPARFPGNEYIWEGVDDKSYAPGIADLAVFVSTHDHCANEAFNHANGDVFIWKNMWPKLAAYFGVEASYPLSLPNSHMKTMVLTLATQAPEPSFAKVKGTEKELINEFDVAEWAKDKREAWQSIVRKWGGKEEVFDWAAWGHLRWGMGRAWSTLLSVGKARRYGWTRYDDTYITWLKTYKVLEGSGILPKPRNVK